MTDVARAAGVSRALVSLVMRGQAGVGERRRAAVLEAARALGYSPDLLARQLAGGRSSLVGVVTDGSAPGEVADLVDGLDAAAEAEGLGLVHAVVGRRAATRDRAWHTLAGLRPCALVVLEPGSPDLLVPLPGLDVPMAVATSAGELPGPGTPPAPGGPAGPDLAADDGGAGTAQLVEHLVLLGHRHLVHVADPTHPAHVARRRGFEHATTRRGLAGDVVDVPAGQGAAAVPHLLGVKAGATAVLAADDVLAVGVLAALRAADVDVPGQVSVVGYGNTAPAALAPLGLTTVAPRLHDLGPLAVGLVLERVRGVRSGPARRRLPPRMVIRRTTAPPPGPLDLRTLVPHQGQPVMAGPGGARPRA